MTGELEKVVRQLFEAFDRKDESVLGEHLTDEARGIDEISRRWLRGRAEIEAYVRQMLPALDEVHSELRDLDEQEWGDAGVVTCWLEQEYVYEGQHQKITAPTTVVLRRVDGAWKVALLHTVPLEEPAST